jgi:DNA-binding NarL/FixJ family response regulator
MWWTFSAAYCAYRQIMEGYSARSVKAVAGDKMQPSSTLGSLGNGPLDQARTKNTPQILIVEDDDAMAHCLECIAGSFGAVMVEATVSGALHRVVANPIWSALIVDLCLPDGSGLDVVSCVRGYSQDAAVLILTGHSGHRAIHAAFDLRALYLDKPATCAQIETFFAWAVRRPRNCDLPPNEPPATLAEPRGLINEKLAMLATRYNFTAIDVEVVRACLEGYSGKEYIEHQKLSVNTYKRRVRRMLRKLGASSVGEVRDRLLRSL